MSAIRAVGVLVPARDEQRRVGACLDAVLTALDRLPAEVATAVCLVVDRSTDGTATAARRTVGRWRRPVDVLVNDAPIALGAVRNQAARTALHRLRAVDPASTWLLSTDADSRVPPEWAVRHLILADAGADAVAGGVVPDGPVPPGALDATGVYGANLGVRGGPFLQVGGFPPLGTGEDHGLMVRLRAGGYTIVTGTGFPVRTSVRVRGRATGGVADRLRTVTTDDRDPVGPGGRGPEPTHG